MENCWAVITTNQALSTLNQTYDLAIEHGIVTENIAHQIKNLPEKKKTDIDYWTFPEFENFLSMIDHVRCTNEALTEIK